jgi:ribosomal protein L7/L12
MRRSGGIQVSEDDAEFAAEILALLAEGQKIEAIKRYRERTGAGLAEAKKAVELLEGQGAVARQPLDPPVEQEIVALLEQGRKIQAIKLYREHTGTGLKEAKQAVEAVAAERGIPSKAGIGCLGLVLIGATTSAWFAFCG